MMYKDIKCFGQQRFTFLQNHLKSCFIKSGIELTNNNEDSNEQIADLYRIHFKEQLLYLWAMARLY